MSWRLIQDFRPKGHAYYADERGRVAIADCSGVLPEDTDDGVLYVDYERLLVVEKASLPLKGDASTPIDGDELAWVIKTAIVGIAGYKP